MGHDVSRTCSILFDPEAANAKNIEAQPVKPGDGSATTMASPGSGEETEALRLALAQKDAELARMREELARSQSVISQAQKESNEVRQQALKHSRTGMS